MRSRLALSCLVLAFLGPSASTADEPRNPCVLLLEALDFPVRELGSVTTPDALSQACEDVRARLTVEPPRELGPDLRDTYDGFVWNDTLIESLRLLGEAGPCAGTCSDERLALDAALRAAIRWKGAARVDALARLAYATSRSTFPDVDFYFSMGIAAPSRALAACTMRARTAGFRAIADTCERIHLHRLEPERAWQRSALPLSARTRAVRCGTTQPTYGSTQVPTIPKDTLLLALDHTHTDALPFDEDEAQRVVEAVRARLAALMDVPWVDHARARAISTDAFAGVAHGQLMCARPLSVDDAYLDAAPNALVVPMAMSCEDGQCEVTVSLWSALQVFPHRMLFDPTISMPSARAGVDAWVRAVDSAPRRVFVRASGRDVGGDLYARTGAMPYPSDRHDGVFTEVTGAALSDRRIPKREVLERFVAAVGSCAGAHTSEEGVEVRLEIEVDERGFATSVVGTSDDPVRARCVERVFESFAMTCPSTRSATRIDVVACSYPSDI